MGGCKTSSRSRVRRILLTAGALLTIAAGAHRAVQIVPVAPAQRQSPTDTGSPENSSPDAAMKWRLKKQFDEKREKDLKTNAARLLMLAQQLKSAVDRSNTHMLSLDVIDKANEIDKLAKKIRDSMRDGR